MSFRNSLLHVVAALVGITATVSARAAFIANITQSGSNVVVSGSGTIDTAGLGSPTVSTGLAKIVPNTDNVDGGPTVSTSLQYYTGISGGPSYLGLGGGRFHSIRLRGSAISWDCIVLAQS